MATLRPFRGIVYDPQRVPLDQVVASLAAGDAEYPFSASKRVALVMKPASHP